MVAPPAPHSWSPARLARRSVTLVRREGLRGLWFRRLAARHDRRVFLLERPLAEPIPRIEAMVALEMLADPVPLIARAIDEARPEARR